MKTDSFQLQKASIDAGQPFAERGVFQFAVVGIYEGDTLPEDFVCPLCKHGAEDFEPLK